ncbi:MAG: DNA primase [Hyphomicrobiaceae bacterium]
MRFTPQLLDEIRARLPVSQVVSRKVALKRKGREFSGLSPFKVEKSPSFFVNDAKGFYHCFASGEHGDIFKFVMTTEGLTFPEAVERLAAEAGVPMPKAEFRDDDRDQARQDERTRLYALLETSAKFFEEQLRSPAGQEARGYLDRRGLKRETLAKFRLGFGPNSRSALKDHLARAGFTVPEMVTSGMLIGGDDIPQPYDRFRNRVMFPITDLKDRVIAFGGRALEKDQPAKYLNSPETPLFHKGGILFNAARARPLAYEREQVIAVEGYMDVVALTEAGFGQSVAPLGTALTEDQVKLLWRMCPEPILCFDGDSAGQKAGFRAIDTVLPHLKPGVSVAFAFLPEGLDPDDLIRQQGPDAMRDILAKARPLVDLLFAREWGAGTWNTPERRASLEQRLHKLIGSIVDDSVREHYNQAMRSRLREAWGTTAPASFSENRGNGGDFRPQGNWKPGFKQPARQGPGRGGARFQGGGNRPGQHPGLPWSRPPASDLLRKSSLAARAEPSNVTYREALLMAALLNHPWLLEDMAEEISAIEFTAPALVMLRSALLSLDIGDKTLDRQSLRSHLLNLELGKVVDLVERAITHKCDRFAEPDADRAEVEAGWRHALALHERQSGLRRALEGAEQEWHDTESEDAFARIREIKALIANSDVLDTHTDAVTTPKPVAMLSSGQP